MCLRLSFKIQPLFWSRSTRQNQDKSPIRLFFIGQNQVWSVVLDVLLPHLDVVNEQHDILGQVEVTEVKDDGVAHHGLPQDPVDL